MASKPAAQPASVPPLEAPAAEKKRWSLSAFFQWSVGLSFAQQKHDGHNCGKDEESKREKWMGFYNLSAFKSYARPVRMEIT